MKLSDALPSGVQSATIENALFEVFLALHGAETSPDVRHSFPDYQPATSFSVAEVDGVVQYTLHATLPLSQKMAAYGALEEMVSDFIPVSPSQPSSK